MCKGREQLITSMNQLTKKGGKVFVMAPERAGTMRKFVNTAEEYFSIGNIYVFSYLI